MRVAEAMAGNPRLGEALRSPIPLRRPGRPEEIAPAVAVLAGEGGFITGQTLSVTGGLTMA